MVDNQVILDELKGLSTAIKTHLITELDPKFDELKNELDQKINALKNELDQKINALRPDPVEPQELTGKENISVFKLIVFFICYVLSQVTGNAIASLWPMGGLSDQIFTSVLFLSSVLGLFIIGGEELRKLEDKK